MHHNYGDELLRLFKLKRKVHFSGMQITRKHIFVHVNAGKTIPTKVRDGRGVGIYSDSCSRTKQKPYSRPGYKEKVKMEIRKDDKKGHILPTLLPFSQFSTIA